MIHIKRIELFREFQKNIIAAVSPDSTRSHNCKNEMTIAVQDGKTLISLMLEDFKLPLGIRLQLATTHFIKTYEYSSDELFEKIYSNDKINACLGDVPSEYIMEKDRKEAEAQKLIKLESERSAADEKEKSKSEVKERKQGEEIVEQKEAKEPEISLLESEKKVKPVESVTQEQERLVAETKVDQSFEEEQKKSQLKKEEENQRQIAVPKDNLQRREDFGLDDDSTIMSDDEETIMTEDDSDETIMEVSGNVPIIVRLNTGELFYGSYPLTSIGRSKNECDLYFENAKTMTGHHADIVIHEGRNFIIDHDSRNHTYFKGEMMQKGGRAEIEDYAEISLSNSEPFFVAFNRFAEWVV